ncbi:uracil-DNA glycosylase [Paenibacillus sp. L3-i20]|uniref:uracil-DNA glycosylase n=1 Tax=Paenibacillus sp. L3-i20 TaxID=2905833 RepID=UPI001EDFEFA2|nr:uracil-DNA glycosylase [Paenibacillus sp. L3-i20]GKU78405.1 uracil-DNA glycosylase [Paenibacillus sp. L3-i20]
MLAIPNNDWHELLKDQLELPVMQELARKLENYYEDGIVYPAKDQLFNALEFTAYKDTKVVILGQDPYHGAGQAHGLSFSVQKGIRQPPSLKNIFKELESDLGCAIPSHGNLESWAKQGVLLLNTVLSVEQSNPGSHQGIGWELFTNRIVELLNEREAPIVFLLWGKHAGAKAEGINAERHLVIQTAHPSPFAARKGFFGSKPFSQANTFLEKNNMEPIQWDIPE